MPWNGRVVQVADGPLIDGERRLEVVATSLNQGSLRFYLSTDAHPCVGDPVEATISITYQEHT